MIDYFVDGFRTIDFSNDSEYFSELDGFSTVDFNNYLEVDGFSTIVFKYLS